MFFLFLFFYFIDRYRAPELLMGASFYTPLIDEWSAGLILLEMLVGEHTFRGVVSANVVCPSQKLMCDLSVHSQRARVRSTHFFFFFFFFFFFSFFFSTQRCECTDKSHINYNASQLRSIFSVLGTPQDSGFLAKMSCYWSLSLSLSLSFSLSLSVSLCLSLSLSQKCVLLL